MTTLDGFAPETMPEGWEVVLREARFSRLPAGAPGLVDAAAAAPEYREPEPWREGRARRWRWSLNGTVGRLLWALSWRAGLVAGLWLSVPTPFADRALTVAVGWVLANSAWTLWRLGRARPCPG